MTKTILIIDDDDDIREATQICLEIIGDWKIITASSGREGLQEATNQKPDVILLDVMMPDMDGIETFTQLQANTATQNIPVIFLTAKAQPAEQRQFTQLKVSGVITKPYDPFELSDNITKILG
ncbi:Response regulator receiver protein [Hyella patelloides LEGE 07179]|uniref:Response regulator receiver protein n=1 Tax=Hyella patelloides LEGE 07179 TaxID=945734 RepID=A0A563VMH1_9CYAN|nr:response regulator [Hyella patelloides]VEP12612.1 Response regulator receiver protein [Hyella patelloides LEGE 07179]